MNSSSRSLWTIFECRRYGGIAIAALSLAIVLRVCLASISIPKQVSDAHEYYEYAKNLAAGNGYFLVAQHGMKHRVYRPPGYPAVRALLIMIFGDNPMAAIWFNVVAEIIALLYTGRAAAAAYGRAAGAWAMLAFAPYILFTSSLMTESLSMALWAAMLSLTLSKRMSSGRSLVAGVLVTFATLVRPTSIFWFLVHMIREFRAQTVSALRLLALAAPVVFGLGAWSLRNYAWYGTPVFVSANFGAHNAADYGIDSNLFDLWQRHGFNEVEIDKRLVRLEIEEAKKHPDRLTKLMKKRLVDLFSQSIAYETLLVHNEVYEDSPHAQKVYKWVWDYVIYAYLLAAVGFLVLIFLGGPSRYIVGSICAFLVLQCLTSRGDIRLLAPIYPALAVCMGVGLRYVVRGARRVFTCE